MKQRAEVVAKSLSIRPAVAADVARVTECMHAAYEPWVPRLGRRPWPMVQDYSAVTEAEWVFVAESAGRLCGVLVLSETNDGLLIDNVAVLPALKGQGVGRALLIRAEQEARARGYDSLYLYTNEKMHENIALYARIGYAEYERRQEEGFCRVFMRKSLC
jgi:GNAT superfamily N-acetyltransferase